MSDSSSHVTSINEYKSSSRVDPYEWQTYSSLEDSNKWQSSFIKSIFCIHSNNHIDVPLVNIGSTGKFSTTKMIRFQKWNKMINTAWEFVGISL